MSTSTSSSPLDLLPRREGTSPHGEGSLRSDPGFARERRSYLAAKRAVDIVGAAAGLTLLLPLMLTIAALIRLESPGPVLFRQSRTGRGGRAFRVLKYRTTMADAGQGRRHLESRNESPCGVHFKLRDDPRVTPLGRFLRRSGLDELPQLFNVLRGEMSLVGPRPLQPRDSERLELLDSAAYARRLTVPPGLTGTWLVGGRSESDCEGMLRLDLEYVDRLTLARDLTILWKTLSVVLQGRGAYRSGCAGAN